MEIGVQVAAATFTAGLPFRAKTRAICAPYQFTFDGEPFVIDHVRVVDGPSVIQQPLSGQAIFTPEGGALLQPAFEVRIAQEIEISVASLAQLEAAGEAPVPNPATTSVTLLFLVSAAVINGIPQISVTEGLVLAGSFPALAAVSHPPQLTTAGDYEFLWTWDDPCDAPVLAVSESVSCGNLAWQGVHTPLEVCSVVVLDDPRTSGYGWGAQRMVQFDLARGGPPAVVFASDPAGGGRVWELGDGQRAVEMASYPHGPWFVDMARVGRCWPRSSPGAEMSRSTGRRGRRHSGRPTSTPVRLQGAPEHLVDRVRLRSHFVDQRSIRRRTGRGARPPLVRSSRRRPTGRR